jgi:hypothetical protein
MKISYRKIRNTMVCALLLGAGTMNAWAQSLMVYPAAGQSPQQQQQDQYNCHGWSVQQSGYDPNNPPAQASTGLGSGVAAKGLLKGGARGAAMGAAIGAIAGDAGKGAAIGATAGGMGGAMKSRDQAAQAASAPPPGLDNYNRAMKSCLGAMGYSVN